MSLKIIFIIERWALQIKYVNFSRFAILVHFYKTCKLIFFLNWINYLNGHLKYILSPVVL